MKIVGVTGGIGAGKSTVCEVIIEMGYPVYNADFRAKQLINTSPDLVASIKAEFGENIYDHDGIDRVALAEIVFNDPRQLEKLNALVHPAVAVDFAKWVSDQNSHIVFKEAAILFESGAHQGVDKSVLVSAPEQIRVERVMKRDGVGESAVKMRMANQWSEDRKRELADHIIINDGQTLIIPQINALLDLWVE